jgi:hypothetical protein
MRLQSPNTFGSFLILAISVLAGLGIARIPACHNWVGCIPEPLVASAAISAVGVALGVRGWVLKEPKRYACLLSVLLNLALILLLLGILAAGIGKV